MTNADKQPSIYVVYPAALFDGWEVVKEHVDDEAAHFATREEATRHAEARASMEGGGVVKLENWFGDIEDAWEAPGSPPRASAAKAGNGTSAARFSVLLRSLRRSGAGR